MRCRLRPGSYFCSVDCSRCCGECWEPLYDLVTSPLRRGRSACPRSRICHVLAPTPSPRGLSPRVARFSSLLRVGGPIHHLDVSACTLLTSPFFLVFPHLKEATPPYSRDSPGDKMAERPTHSAHLDMFMSPKSPHAQNRKGREGGSWLCHVAVPAHQKLFKHRFSVSYQRREKQ